MFVGGEWIAAADDGAIETTNSWTAKRCARIPRGGAGDVGRAVAAAHNAFADEAQFQRGVRLAAPRQLPASGAIGPI